MTQSADIDLDRIERSIDIDATAEKVWTLLTRPGWWINEHGVEPEPDLRVDGDTAVLTHPKWGTFTLVTERSAEPRDIAYRWIMADDQEGTLVEFSVADRPGGVRLTVVETGFLSLGKERADVLTHVQQNTEGWTSQLEAGATFVLATP